MAEVAAAARSHLALMDQAAMGRRQYAIWLLASGGTLLDGFSIFSLGVAMPLATRHFALSPLMVGLIGSALVLGAAGGAMLGGSAADRFGRKPLLLLDMAILAVGAFLSATSGTPHIMLAGQFLVGIGIGIDFPVSASYVSETMPKNARSRMMVATIALQSVGMLIGAAVSLAMLAIWPGVVDWRYILATTGIGGCVFLLARLWLSESPRWLMQHGRGPEAAKIVSQLAKTQAPPLQLDKLTTKERGLAPLVSKPYRIRTLLVSVPWFLMDIATYGVGLFTPVILAAIHVSGAKGGPVATEFAAAQGSALIDLFLFFGFLIGLWAVPRFGRIHMQVGGFAGMMLGMLVLLFAVTAGSTSSAHLAMVFAGFILFNLAMNAGPNATTFTLAPELFPTGIRASASGFAAAAAKLGATLGIFVLPQVKEFAGVAGVLLLMALVSAAGAIVTAWLASDIREVPEGIELEAVSRAA
jgi:MFS family permease